MSVEVIGFEAFEESRDIERVQRDLIEVFLEGPDDVRLFADFWFVNYLERIDFKRPTQAGGCEAVVAAVERSRRLGEVPAYGIVDRDAWRRRKEIRTFLEPDDRVFVAHCMTAGVYVTLYWEIEAYLLQPEAICTWVSIAWPRAPARPCSVSDMADRLAKHGECVLETTPLNMFLHHIGESEIPRFGFGESEAERIRNLVDLRMNDLCIDLDRERIKGDLSDLLETIRGRGAALPGQAKLEFLLRFVDSKMLIARIARAFNVVDVRVWSLAQMMKSADRRPRELQDVLDAILAEHPDR